MPAQIIGVIVAIVVGLASLLGIGLGVGSSQRDCPSGTWGSSNPPVCVPKGEPATDEQLDDVLASTWIPKPSYKGNTISFTQITAKEWKNLTGSYMVDAPGTCNGVGVALAPVPGRSALKRTGLLATTEMACPGLEYEMWLAEFFAQGANVLVDGPDTVLLTNPKGTLTLTRAK